MFSITNPIIDIHRVNVQSTQFSSVNLKTRAVAVLQLQPVWCPLMMVTLLMVLLVTSHIKAPPGVGHPTQTDHLLAVRPGGMANTHETHPENVGPWTFVNAPQHCEFITELTVQMVLCSVTVVPGRGINCLTERLISKEGQSLSLFCAKLPCVLSCIDARGGALRQQTHRL